MNKNSLKRQFYRSGREYPAEKDMLCLSRGLLAAFYVTFLISYILNNFYGSSRFVHLLASVVQIVYAPGMFFAAGLMAEEFQKKKENPTLAYSKTGVLFLGLYAFIGLFIDVTLKDYALFTALKKHFSGQMWTKWPDKDIRFRKPDAVRRYREELADEIDYHIFCQYLFRKQWFSLKKYCNERSVLLFGDMPIYVAEDSADTWTHPDIFQLDKNLVPKRVAGVPPDYFSADGQLWGNPLYRWTYLRFSRKFDWWVDRMKGMAELYDMIRIDHFIGFANYYSIKNGMPNARKGRWVIGPGKALFRRLDQETPGIRIIAEDLGCVNRRVRRLLDWCGYPGMKVLTFGFDSDESNPHFIGLYEKNTVAYTGTHDNDTTLGWARKADPKALAFAEKTLGFSGADEAPEAFIRALFKSPCETVVIPMQDVLGLDTYARMNYPGTIGNNWTWRMKPDQLSLDLSMKYYRLNRETDRL